MWACTIPAWAKREFRVNPVTQQIRAQRVKRDPLGLIVRAFFPEKQQKPEKQILTERAGDRARAGACA
jgi:hypothetical protein